MLFGQLNCEMGYFTRLMYLVCKSLKYYINYLEYYISIYIFRLCFNDIELKKRKKDKVSIKIKCRKKKQRKISRPKKKQKQ